MDETLPNFASSVSCAQKKATLSRDPLGLERPRMTRPWPVVGAPFSPRVRLAQYSVLALHAVVFSAGGF